MKHPRISRSLWAAGFLLTLTLGCKKQADTAPPTPTPTAVACQLKRIDYGTAGEYEIYESDANGRLAKYWLYYLDENGKVPATVDPSTLSYNTQGLLDRVSSPGYYEQYSYTNGALSKIELFVQNKKAYQFDVTTNANKQITSLKGISFDKDPNSPYSLEYTSTYTLDAQGRYTALSAKNAAGQEYIKTVRTGFEPMTKSYYETWMTKGLPVDVTYPALYYGYYYPVSSGLALKEEDYYGYDDNGKFVGLQKIGDYSFTRKANSNGYVIERSATNSVDKSTITAKYQYSNCN